MKIANHAGSKEVYKASEARTSTRLGQLVDTRGSSLSEIMHRIN